MYWARYVLVDQALRGGGMRSTECPYSLEYIARRRGETFVQATLIDVLPDILKALPLKEIEELILLVIIGFLQ